MNIIVLYFCFVVILFLSQTTTLYKYCILVNTVKFNILNWHCSVHNGFFLILFMKWVKTKNREKNNVI